MLSRPQQRSRHQQRVDRKLPPVPVDIADPSLPTLDGCVSTAANRIEKGVSHRYILDRELM